MLASDLRSLWNVRLRPPPELRQTLLSWFLPGVAATMLLIAAASSMSSAWRSGDHGAAVAEGVQQLRALVIEIAARGEAERLRSLALGVAGRESTVVDDNLAPVESRLFEQWASLAGGIDSELGDTSGPRAREQIEADLSALALAVRGYAAGDLGSADAELERATAGVDDLQRTLAIISSAKRSDRRLAGFGGALWLFAATVTGGLATWRWQRRIGWLRYRDPVTGLPNHDSFEGRTQRAIDRAPDTELAIVLMNVHRFRLINESLGQHAGDILLARIAKRLAAHLHSEDLLARFTGDQFAVFTRAGVDRTIFAIHRAVAEPFEEGEHTLDISFSIGFSRYPADGDRAERLIGRASTAMNRAKREGGVGPAAFTQNLDSSSNGRLLLESELRHATNGEQFVLQYQPQFSASDLQLTGMEALIRWNHPKRGFVLPGEFIPVLEDCDLIVPVGAWILETACSQVREWLDDGLDAVPVSVNVSARQLLRPDFPAIVAGALSAANLPPQYLEIEVTETLAIEQVEVATRVFADLRSQGMRVALDDFGQGHSSLARLSQIPLDTLKIDRSFIEEMTESKESVSLVEGIIFLARALKLDVVAEGVETEEQLRLLRELNCDVVQGYLLAHPLDEQAIRELLAEQAAARWESLPANA